MPMTRSMSAGLGRSPLLLPAFAASIRQLAASRRYMSSAASPLCMQLDMSQSPKVYGCGRRLAIDRLSPESCNSREAMNAGLPP